MLVRYWMTEEPVTTTEGENLLSAYRAMEKHGIRRLLVVREGELCGVISKSDLYRLVEPSAARDSSPTLDFQAQLAQQTVAEFMTTSPLTCGPDDALEEVGELMRQRKVGALPVIRRDRLVGIITESDIFKALTVICHCGGAGRRLCYRIPSAERALLFREIVDLCARHDLDLGAILSHPLKESPHHIVMARVRGGRVDELVECLWEKGYQVLQVSGEGA